jgi:hypothetical protein
MKQKTTYSHFASSLGVKKDLHEFLYTDVKLFYVFTEYMSVNPLKTFPESGILCPKYNLLNSLKHSGNHMYKHVQHLITLYLSAQYVYGFLTIRRINCSYFST